MNNTIVYEVLRDFRKGGLSPNNYNEFVSIINSLPPIHLRTIYHLKAFDNLKLEDISDKDFKVVLREVNRRIFRISKKCWHPYANPTTCDAITDAHSIQNNGILDTISKDSHVIGYGLDSAEFEGKLIGKNIASTFMGFCNIHDAIFYPIETTPYKGSNEQNFLFAYRAFIASAHAKVVSSQILDFGPQSFADIQANKAIFDTAIIASNFSIIETEVFELPAFYPFAASSSFYLEFDFLGKYISHSAARMENIFITFFPRGSKSYFLISYFKIDAKKYSKLADQLRHRNNLKSDISVLIAGHVENIYFNPIYYDTFIKDQVENIERLVDETQPESQFIDFSTLSNTPHNYLNNSYGISFFGY